MQECIDEIKNIQSLYKYYKDSIRDKEPLGKIPVERILNDVYNLGDLMFIPQESSILVIESNDLFRYIHWASRDKEYPKDIFDKASGFHIEFEDREEYVNALEYMQSAYIRKNILAKAREDVDKLTDEELPF